MWFLNNFDDVGQRQLQISNIRRELADIKFEHECLRYKFNRLMDYLNLEEVEQQTPIVCKKKKQSGRSK